ncbi:uncharacterized protein METZ01_LOCUS346868 [marine metagenome]|uniref:Outer membrane protein beta-barrel domain-containing protein n=1 Tax=marine metagenome TaxID=408172 RepID=A0A382R8G8_9ZZZZ
MIRKIIISWIAATSLILFSTQAFALINFSVGVPLSHTFSGKYNGGDEVKSDGVSGYFIQIGVPILPGIGMDSYKTKLKDWSDPTDLETSIYNLYYLLPIPVINLTLGAGVGSTEIKCDTCSKYYDKGGAVQGYASFGFPIIPLFDLHLSYRSITTKVKGKGSNEGNDVDLSGNVMGIGIMFNF